MNEYILIVGQTAVAYVDKYLLEIKVYVGVDTRYLYKGVEYQRYGLKRITKLHNFQVMVIK